MDISVNSSAQFIVKKRALVYLFCIIVLEAFCYINSFEVDLKGASVDAERFQYKAIYWINHGSMRFVTGAELYIQLLGMFFSVFGPYEFIAAQISVLSLVGSAIYFERILKLFSVKYTYVWVIPLMLWPSLITRATTTMREPILIFLSILFVYYMLMCVRSRSPRHAALAILFLIPAGLLHKAYAVLLVLMVPFIVFVVLRQSAVFYKSKIFYSRLTIVMLFLGMTGFVFLNHSETRGLQPVVSMIKGDTAYMQMVVDAKSSRQFRTTYKDRLNFSSPQKLISSAPGVLARYLFSPYPWEIINIYDVYAFLEGFFRLIALVVATILLLSGRVTRMALLSILVFLFILTTIWAAGTTNYGTASRHHTTTNWVYLMFIAIAYHFRYFSLVKRKPGPDQPLRTPVRETREIT